MNEKSNAGRVETLGLPRSRQPNPLILRAIHSVDSSTISAIQTAGVLQMGVLTTVTSPGEGR